MYLCAAVQKVRLKSKLPARVPEAGPEVAGAASFWEAGEIERPPMRSSPGTCIPVLAVFQHCSTCFTVFPSRLSGARASLMLEPC